MLYIYPVRTGNFCRLFDRFFPLLCRLNKEKNAAYGQGGTCPNGLRDTAKNFFTPSMTKRRIWRCHCLCHAQMRQKYRPGTWQNPVSPCAGNTHEFLADAGMPALPGLVLNNFATANSGNTFSKKLDQKIAICIYSQFRIH